MLPIPPRTDAVKAAIPGVNPMYGLTWPNVSPNWTPATPASSPPRANVIMIVRSTSIPIRLAISRSSATARIERPVRVREMNSVNPITATTAVTITTTWIRCIVMPKIVHVLSPPRTSGTG